jgi:hypothetical protein
MDFRNSAKSRDSGVDIQVNPPLIGMAGCDTWYLPLAFPAKSRPLTASQQIHRLIFVNHRYNPQAAAIVRQPAGQQPCPHDGNAPGDGLLSLYLTSF